MLLWKTKSKPGVKEEKVPHSRKKVVEGGGGPLRQRGCLRRWRRRKVLMR